MAVSTYQELKVSIASWCKRSDVQSLVDDFIDMAESDIWSVLRVREMEYRDTLITNGVDRYIDLPADYIKMRQLQIVIDEKPYDLDEVPLKAMCVSDVYAIPSQFAVTTQIETNCIADDIYDIEIDYFRKLTPLSADAPTNDILTNYPQLYLSASLAHAFRWQRLNEDAEYWEGKFRRQVADANRQSRNGRFGPAPAMRQNRGMIV